MDLFYYSNIVMCVLDGNKSLLYNCIVMFMYGAPKGGLTMTRMEM